MLKKINKLQLAKKLNGALSTLKCTSNITRTPLNIPCLPYHKGNKTVLVCPRCGALFHASLTTRNISQRKTGLCPTCISQVVGDARRKEYLKKLTSVVTKDDVKYIRESYQSFILNCCYSQSNFKADPMDIFEKSYLTIIYGLVRHGIVQKEKLAKKYIKKTVYWNSYHLYMKSKKEVGFEDLPVHEQGKYVDVVNNEHN